MIGDAADVRQRLRLALPTHWFGDVAPVLDGLLAGLGAGWEQLYNLLQFVKAQSRIGSATGDFLDAAAWDFFGNLFSRRALEADQGFRSRLQAAMRRERATRAALVETAAAAGYAVTIFEPARAADTGAYNVAAGLAWNSRGGWGSLQMPFECLMTAQRTSQSVETELWPNVAAAMPAGGAAWIRIGA